MSRKTFLTDVLQESAKQASEDTTPIENSTRVLSGSVRSMGLVLGNMENKANELQKALDAGATIIELDPADIEGSIIRDRLEIALTLDDDLVRSIEETGQEVPILVRQHPDDNNKYQVAYGHRRLAAAKLLNRKVRAVVRQLTDEELVVAQGVENSARQDLSYIERALFAFNLSERGFSRNVIMKALAAGKSDVSTFLSVTSKIPADVIAAIGPAPSIGRRRWMELTDEIYEKNKMLAATVFLKTDKIIKLDSDQRFEALFRHLKKENSNKIDPKHKGTAWIAKDQTVNVLTKTKANGLSLDFSKADGIAFGDWISGQLDELYQAFRGANPDKKGD